jgi:hypothetical protein
MSSKEFQNFNAAMSTILRANPKAVKEAMEQQKLKNFQQRKAKKKPSARVSSAKD